MAKSEKIIILLDKTIEILLVGIVFLVPLYFNVLTYLSFEIDKIVLFRSLVELATFLYLVRAILVGRLEFLKNAFFYLSVFLILASQALATLLSAHPAVSFWGSYWRGFGLFTYLHLFIFGFLVLNFVHRNNLKRFFGAASLSAFLASLYGLVQVFGLDFLKWQGVADGLLLRANSTLGQPNFLASYLLLVLPLTFYLVLRSRGFWPRLLFSLFLLAQSAALVFTYSRGAWVGLFLAMLGSVLIYSFKKNKKIFSVFLLLVAFGLVGLVFLNKKESVRLPVNGDLTLARRLESLANIHQDSMSSRLFYYQAALDLIKNRPLAGYGLDNQAYYFSRYYQPDWAIYEQINRYTDRAHDEWLDVLLTTGCLGLAAWLFFLLLSGRAARLVFISGSREDKLIAGALAFGLASFYISILFTFFTIVGAVYFWMMAALLFRLSGPEEFRDYRFQIRKILGLILIPSFFISILYLIWSVNVENTLADRYYRKAMEAEVRQDFKGALENLDAAIGHHPREPYYRAQLALLRPPEGLPYEEKIKILEYLKETAGAAPRDLSLEGRLYIAQILSEIGRLKLEAGAKPGETEEFGEADRLYRQAVQAAPGIALIKYDWGNSYFDRRDYDSALSE